MALTETPICEFGLKAPDFKLPGIDGKQWSLADCRGERGTLVMFICNHCPYVRAIADRLVRDTRELLQYGVESVAIMPNDTENYPEDSFENMQKFAKKHDFPFPYLIDETQEVARAYGAVCTPDFFGYNATWNCSIAAAWTQARWSRPGRTARRELFEAMKQVAEDRSGTTRADPEHGLLNQVAKLI
jgi:peroxiredoxin